mmetsp:Transcript_35369/g.82140  ORF Transcript_35369/g.82140 Transcript_35369/m.82140 type:complete len:219 (-) Transcript_35369:57-713(-)
MPTPPVVRALEACLADGAAVGALHQSRQSVAGQPELVQRNLDRGFCAFRIAVARLRSTILKQQHLLAGLLTTSPPRCCRSDPVPEACGQSHEIRSAQPLAKSERKVLVLQGMSDQCIECGSSREATYMSRMSHVRFAQQSRVVLLLALQPLVDLSEVHKEEHGQDPNRSSLTAAKHAGHDRHLLLDRVGHQRPRDVCLHPKKRHGLAREDKVEARKQC